ncbi:hypothetical protein ACIQMY_02845 [Streptomyces sp. NPDC091368]|uniref:hypothetical protein n=1 Tax=Streptomyces sp. NPDC091368 TaxID=3365993 RepID=UPI0037F3C95A
MAEDYLDGGQAQPGEADAVGAEFGDHVDEVGGRCRADDRTKQGSSADTAVAAGVDVAGWSVPAESAKGCS